MKRHFLYLILLVMASCSPKLEPEEPCHFVQNSQVQRVSWKSNLPIKLYIHESFPEEERRAVFEAMAQWEYIIGRSLFKMMGVKKGEISPKKDGESVIYWLTDSWDDGRRTEQARTTIYWVGDRIGEADIRVNDLDYNFYVEKAGIAELASSADVPGDKVDLQSLMVHELGHVLGLKHNDEIGSVMAVTLPNGLPRRIPSDSDSDALKCEYL